jgi:hypothetical protein
LVAQHLSNWNSARSRRHKQILKFRAFSARREKIVKLI